MKEPKDLSRKVLERIALDVQSILFYDDDALKLNADKEWDIGMLEDIAEVLYRAGMRPDEEEEEG